MIRFPAAPIQNIRHNLAEDFYKLFSIIIILASNTLQISLQPMGFRQGDSWAYGFSNMRDWELVSFTGHALRKWPLVLTNTIIGNIQLQMFLQTIFSCFAWIYLVHVVSRTYGQKNPAILVIGILGSTRQIVSWNSIQLSESWSISSLVVVIALIISLSQKFSRKKAFYFLLFLLIALNTKPSTLLAAVILFPILVLFIFYSKRTRLLTNNKSLTIATIGVLAYSSLLNVNQAAQNLQDEGTGQSYAAAQATAVISNINPEARAVIKEISKVKQVSCLALSEFKTPQELTEAMKNGCKESEVWLTENFPKWYLAFLISNPVYVSKIFATSLSAGNSPYSMYGGSVSILPETLTELFFGNRNYANRLNQDSAQKIEIDKIEIVSPIFFWLILGFLILAFARFQQREYRSAPLGNPWTACGVLISLGVITVLVSGVLIPNEWFRQSIVGQVEIFIGVILLGAEYWKIRFRQQTNQIKR